MTDKLSGFKCWCNKELTNDEILSSSCKKCNRDLSSGKKEQKIKRNLDESTKIEILRKQNRKLRKELKEIKEVRAQIACMLNELWHSRLPKIHWSNVVRNTHYVCYAFFYKQAVIGVGIWSSPVAQNRMKNGKKILELRRLALSELCPFNTASFVISQMIKKIKIKFPEIIKLISYQDTTVHRGTIYKASNWKKGIETKFVSWNNKKRKRNKDQSNSSKIRWEYEIETKREINN